MSIAKFVLILADNLDAKKKPRTQSETLEAIVKLFRARHGEPHHVLAPLDFTGKMDGITVLHTRSLPIYHFMVNIPQETLERKQHELQ